MTREKYITIPRLAELTGMSRIAIYKKVKKGQIPAIRIGRNYAITDRTIAQVLGEELSEKGKRQIDTAVTKTVEQYGEVIRELSNK
ncbi:MAG: helix-turn-helix transcriptional regulator [Candidatus Neomarinimicrobiota bacterium]